MKHMYLRVKNNNTLNKKPTDRKNAHRGDPVGCVSFVRITSFDGFPYLIYALSLSNPRDKFDKSLARKISNNRLAAVLQDRGSPLDLDYVLKNQAAGSPKNKFVFAIPRHSQDGGLVESIRLIMEDIPNRINEYSRAGKVAREWTAEYAIRRQGLAA